jgi:WD40 repeat protein
LHDSLQLEEGAADDVQELQPSWEILSDRPDAHKSQIYAMTSVGTHIYSSAHRSLKVWDVETMKIISELPEKLGLVRAITFWREKNLLLAAAEKTIMMWDVVSMTAVSKFTGFKEEIKALQLIPETNTLYAASKGTADFGGLLIFDLRNNQSMENKEKSQDIFSLTASDTHLFYGSRNHSVTPFDLKT